VPKLTAPKSDDKEARWLLDEKYKGKESPAFLKDLRRLHDGEPLAYIIGNVPFLGTIIYLKSRPLIPRPETEFWVEKAIIEIRREQTGKPINCLDIFAGSGCIGVALLALIPSAKVDFGEKEESHIKDIKTNIEKNGIDNIRTKIFTSDVFKGIPPKKYDYIFANPPYVSTEDMDAAQESVKKWEPRGAIFAGHGGLFYIEETLKDAMRYLSPNGVLLMEFDPAQKEKLKTLAQTYGYAVLFDKDQYGRYRLAAFTKK